MGKRKYMSWDHNECDRYGINFFGVKEKDTLCDKCKENKELKTVLNAIRIYAKERAICSIYLEEIAEAAEDALKNTIKF